MQGLEIPLVQQKNNSGECTDSSDSHSHERLRWFLVFALGGASLTILSMFWLLSSIVTFAVLYTLGSISMITSLFILSGAKKQFATISDRPKPALAYLTAMGCTLALALYPGVWFRSLLVFLCVILQFLALGWYTLTFFPRLQERLKRIVRFLCATET